MGSFRIKKGWKYRTSTKRIGHYRKIPSGGRTYVQTHDMCVTKRKYLRSYTPSQPRLIKNLGLKSRLTFPSKSKLPYILPKREDYEHSVVNKAFDISITTFPQYAPLIKTGRFLYNHRSEVKNAVNIVLSEQSADSKIEDLTRLVGTIVKTKAKTAVASECAKALTDIIDSKNGFSKLDSQLKLGLNYQNKTRFRNFFQSSVENLILDSLG